MYAYMHTCIHMYACMYVLIVRRSLDKLNQYRSRVRPAARGGQVRWSGYLPSTGLPKRGSSGANLAALTSFAGGREKSMSGSSLVDKQVNPGLVTIHNAVALLPINYSLAKAYRYVRLSHNFIVKL